MLNKKPAYRVAIVGATGAVGAEMIEVLEERKFPIETLIPLASSPVRRRDRLVTARSDDSRVDQGFV